MAFRPLYTPILFSVALSRLMSTYDIPRSPGRNMSVFHLQRCKERKQKLANVFWFGSLGWESGLVMSSGASSGRRW